MTDLDLRAGQIHRGLGIVSRWADIALVIPSDSNHDAAVDEMFSELGTEPTAATILAAINELLSKNKLGAVGLLTEATGGPLGIVFGGVEILADGQVLLDGGAGLVKQQVSGMSHRLTIRAANLTKAAEPVAPFDLRRGVAPGAGLTLLTVPAALPLAPSNQAPPGPERGRVEGIASKPRPRLSPRPTAEPSPSVRSAPKPLVPKPQAAASKASDVSDLAVPSALPPAQDASLQSVRSLDLPFRSVVLTSTKPTDTKGPLPLATDAQTGELDRSALDAGRVKVNGILCPRDHFNNPETSFCMVCGISVAHLSGNLVEGPRPTLGFVVFDDGSTFGLDRSYLVGREPVANDDTQLLVLHDNNETLSRTHARIELVDWAVHLIDFESTNGTYIWDQSFERWNQLAPGHPVVLASGDTVALGRRTFVFESVRRT